jgi:aryl-alcohol dehydrogenase-like predicted oxidoreductase
MGGYDYGKVVDDESIKAVRKALDMGINFFDTADIYGFGHAEEVLSGALGNDRHKVVIATKFGLTWDKEGNVTRDSSAKRVVTALEASLRRLKVDAISLYQVHWIDPVTPIEETVGALLKCQQEGKVRYIGFSNVDRTLIEKAQKICRIDSIQSSYNLLNRLAEREVIPFCHKSDIAFVAHSPLARGFLTGKYDTGQNFTGADTRAKSAYFSMEMSVEKGQVLEEIQRIGIQCGHTSTHVVLRWILDNPLITALVMGVKKMNQLEEGVGSLGWKLNPMDYDSLSMRSEVFANAGLY